MWKSTGHVLSLLGGRYVYTCMHVPACTLPQPLHLGSRLLRCYLGSGLVRPFLVEFRLSASIALVLGTEQWTLLK